MNKHPIQQLLRPAHEFPIALAYLLAAMICVISPSVLLGAIHTPVVSYSLAAMLAARGIYRMHWAIKLWRYQYQLHVLPKYEISSRDIPISKKELFLGRGFEWRARHTQRLTDFSRTEFDYHHDRGKGFINQSVRRFEDWLRSTKIMQGYERWVSRLPVGSFIKGLLLLLTLYHITGKQSWANPVAPVPYVEGVPAVHAVGLWEKEGIVELKQGERVAHMFVVGTTRVGKTRLAEVLVTQDIHNDEVVIVFDPKGDADLLKRMYVEAAKAGRLDNFYCFHLGFPEFSARYNPVGTFGRVTEPASRIASQLPGEGQSATFREFTWRYVNVIAKAMTTLGMTISYESLNLYAADMDPLLSKYLEHLFDQPKAQAAFHKHQILDWRKAVENIANDEDIKQPREQKSRDRKAWAAAYLYKEAGIVDATAHALIKTFEYEKSFYDKLVASLFPLLEKLTSGPTAELLSPNYLDDNDKRPIFDWDKIIRTGGIVYVGLDALSDADVAQAVGNSMFADLTSRAGAIYKGGVNEGLPEEIAALGKRRKICVHADEFNELVGKEFIPLANKAGGAGFQLTVYTQTLSDIKARFGDAAKAGQVIGNLGSLVMLRVKEPETAELLTKQLKDVEVNQLTLVSGASDDSNPNSGVDFTSSTQQRITSQRVPMISNSDVMDLPKGQAFARLGGKLYKVRLPLFSDEAELPKTLDFMYGEMKKRYANAQNDNKWSELPEYQNLPDIHHREVA